MTPLFSEIQDVYEILSNVCSLYSTIPKEVIDEAFKFSEKYYREKYGTDDYRYREVFAQKQSGDFESIDRLRAVVHCEVEGAPHIHPVKGFEWSHCQQCSYIDSLSIKWEGKPKGLGQPAP